MNIFVMAKEHIALPMEMFMKVIGVKVKYMVKVC